MKEIEWSSAARKILSRLDRTLAGRLITAMERFAALGHGDVKKLKGSDELRLRVGGWRIRFRDTPDRVEVVSIKPRGDAYK